MVFIYMQLNLLSIHAGRDIPVVRGELCFYCQPGSSFRPGTLVISSSELKPHTYIS